MGLSEMWEEYKLIKMKGVDNNKHCSFNGMDKGQKINVLSVNFFCP